MSLALFDFDGTITSKDSMVEFIQYAVGKKNYYLGLLKLSPILVAYKLKLYPNDRAKKKFLFHFFKDIPPQEFQMLATQYATNEIDKIVRKEAIERISWHKEQGDEVVIVSASMACWLKAWCESNEIKLIATELEISNNIFTGKFTTKNCYGEEKVNRIKSLYDIEKYSYVYAYGDSRGDRELLALGDESFYKPFR